MKRLICLLLMGSLMAQNSKENQYPIPIKPFELTYEDIQPILGNTGKLGRISLEFEINKNGEVENPIVLDSFNIRLNSVVIDKNDPVIVLYGNNWHEGVIGIIASRIKEKFNTFFKEFNEFFAFLVHF